MNARRNLFAVLGLAALSACVVNLSFVISQTAQLQAPSGKSVSLVQQYDLLSSSEVAAHKANIKSIDIESIVATVVTHGSTNAATTVTGTLALRKNPTDPAANDVPVATVTNFSLADGSTQTFPGSPALDQFITNVLQGDGKFVLVLSGAVDRSPIDVTLKLDVHSSIAYDAGVL